MAGTGLLHIYRFPVKAEVKDTVSHLIVKLGAITGVKPFFFLNIEA